MTIVDERFVGLRRELAMDARALELQAKEYARRLEDLNHAHARAQEALNTFVRIDKYEDQVKAAEQARKIAVERLNEKLEALSVQINTKVDDYITKDEARQAKLDQAMAIQRGAAEEAQRASEEQGRKNRDLAEAQTRKTNRNMALVTIALSIIIAVSNWAGSG